MRPGARDILALAPPGSRRLRAFQATLAGHGLPPARVLPWTALAAGESLADLVREGTVVRLESPGEDWPTERAILELGDREDEEGDLFESLYERLPRAAVRALEPEPGRLLPSRQWFLGFRALLERVGCELEGCPPHRLTQHPGEVGTMFDKRATHARLEEAGVRVPPALGPVSGFEDLLEKMGAKGWRRAFLKLAHGSSAAGAAALETDGRRWQATSTAEMVRERAGVRLYNSRRLVRYGALGDVRALVDALCRQRAHVERWLPKAGFGGRVFDLRVVVVAGRAAQVLVRLAGGPITNLHLGNERGDWDAVRGRLGEAAWAAARVSCEGAMRCFPASLYGGVDLLVEPGGRRHAVLEVNAFGDYHRGVLMDGLDTYGTELRALGMVP